MLGKLGGIFAPRPSTGPHKLRECLPLVIILRNRLKYALNSREAMTILMQRLVKVDGKVRTDQTFPAGFMDVVSIERTNELFRLLYDVKGRFVLHRIAKEEAAYKLCKVKRQQTGPRAIPFVATHDGRTIRYPDPTIRVDDTVMIDIESGKIIDVVKFDVGNLVMVTGGHNIGRVGVMALREKHPGSTEIVRIRDADGHEFATKKSNVFIIGKGSKGLVSLPKHNGIKQSILERAEQKKGNMTV